jgi:hexosaminidase
MTENNKLMLIPAVESLEFTSGIWVIPKQLSNLRFPEALMVIRNSERITYKEIESDKKDDEAYSLSIDKDGIIISASSTKGFHYASVTFIQLLLFYKESIPCLKINDSPRFGWRGFMLDCCRFFQPVDSILELIDVLSFYKFNTLHLHLTEDQGWRLEIPGYPELTRIGCCRADSVIKDNRHTMGELHEGFYSEEDIRKIVEYASERCIQVIPEIDLPGHTMAALASYPELGCKGDRPEVPWKAGIYKDILCPGKEETKLFVEAVLKQTARLFPASHVHLGGDEAPKARWKKCPHCAAYREDHGIKSLEDQQVYFTNQAVSILNDLGKTPIVWAEICGDDLDKSVIGQYWLFKKKNAYKQLEKGRKMIFSAHASTYIDLSHAYVPLKKIYAYDPIAEGDNPPGAESILGVECPLWTEWVHNKDRRDFQAFPRSIAMAEVGWTNPEDKDYKDFVRRLERHFVLLKEWGINAAPAKEWNPGLLAKLRAMWRMLVNGGVED